MREKEKNFLSAVVYVHNAEERIEQFLTKLIETFESNFEHSEIICVNDSSEDESLARIRKASSTASHTSVSVLNMSHFHGLESAMNAGLELTIGDFVFEFDNTCMDYDLIQIMDVYRKSLEGYDIVSAVPDRPERLSSRLFYSVLDKFAHLPYKMHTESFRILSRRVINRVGSMNKAVPYRKVVYATSGLKAASIVYKPVLPKKGLDQRENRYRSGLAMDALILFTTVGYQFSAAMTFLMMLISVIAMVYSILVYAMAKPVAGWTTTILFLSVAFFGLFGILTIIIKYLQLLVNLVFKRKQYTFESIEKLTK